MLKTRISPEFAMIRRGTVSAGSSPLTGESQLFTARELEALLKIDVKTIYSYVQRGLIPYVKIQSNVRFRREEILDWIERQTFRP